MSEWDDENDYALIFDHFYTSNHIQILKSLLPFIDSEKPSYLPVLIKYMELQYTIELTKKGIRPANSTIKASSNETPDPEQIYHTIKKYLTPAEDKSLQQILNMMQTFENMKEMQKMMELFQNMNGDENASSNPFSDLSGLENMMGQGFHMSDMMQLFNQIKE